MLTDEHVVKLYDIFRRKMHDVYRKNYTPDPFGNAMVAEYNAWQAYLRTSLSLEVVDVEDGYQPGTVRLGGQPVGVRITNPSNGRGFSREFILIPLDIAEKVLALGDLPDEL